MKNKTNSGSMLVIVLFFTLVFTILGYGLLNLSCVNAIETVNLLQSNQAFWIAEAGIERAKYFLKVDSSFRTDGMTENFGNGAYTILIEDIVENGIISAKITNTGTINNQTRVLEAIIDFVWPSASKYAVFQNSATDPLILLSTDIIGDIYVPLRTDRRNSTVTGDEILNGGEFPDFNTTYYSNKLAEAENPDNPDRFVGNVTYTETQYLNNETRYIDGDLNITNPLSQTSISINGPGILVVTGNVNIASRDEEAERIIANDVTVISGGDLTVGSYSLHPPSFTKGPNVNGTLYSQQKVELIGSEDEHCEVSGSILSEDEVGIIAYTDVNGLIYAGQEANLHPIFRNLPHTGSSINGSLIANSIIISDKPQGIQGIAHFNITYTKPDGFPPPGIADIESRQWEEL